jgi:cellulose synthase/poly-beta-1,6-N-acetylglucosamine synthase-like glycosyltransferase
MIQEPDLQRHPAATDAVSSVDVVVPVYNERADALEATLSACRNQTCPVQKIFVVDDGSHIPVSLPGWARFSPQFCLLRLERNQGISAARNAAISLSTACFLACVNTEVLPALDWMATCASYLAAHPKVGACYTRTVPEKPDTLLTQWRLRFQEPKFDDKDGPSPFAHGHAAMFRKSALDSVSGYDVRLRVAHEDSDISRRLWAQGWEVYFLASSHCTSIQQDTLRTLVAKQLRDINWESPKTSSLSRLYIWVTLWSLVRIGRNLAKARFHFLPVDLSLWAYAVWIGTWQTVRHWIGVH